MTASTKILDVASGFVISKCYELTGRPTLCKEIDAQVPEGLDIHILTHGQLRHLQDAQDQAEAAILLRSIGCALFRVTRRTNSVALRTRRSKIMAALVPAPRIPVSTVLCPIEALGRPR